MSPTNIEPGFAAKRILIADETEQAGQTIAGILGPLGALCTVCTDGVEAMNLLNQQEFDLIISDVKVPRHNGYEIFVAARRLTKALPVIMTTAFGFDPHHSIVRASQEGLSNVLFKPFTIRHLLDEVRKALGDQPPQA